MPREFVHFWHGALNAEPEGRKIIAHGASRREPDPQSRVAPSRGVRASSPKVPRVVFQSVLLQQGKRRLASSGDRSRARSLVEKTTCTNRQAKVCGMFLRP